jgi:hypothetical protein
MAFRIIYKYLSRICCFCFDEPDETKNEGNYTDMNNDNVYVNNDLYSNNRPNSSYERYSLSDEDQNITYNQIYRQ